MKPRYTDTMREIVEIEIGAGCDQLKLSCGHSVVRSHKAKWGKRTRCHHVGCRIWTND